MPSFALFDDVVIVRTDSERTVGVGVSNYAVSASRRSVVVSGNIVRSASVGGIVPTVFDGTWWNRYGTAEYGNDLATTVGSVTFGHNRYL